MKKLILVLLLVVAGGCENPYVVVERERMRKVDAAFAAHPDWPEVIKEKIRCMKVCRGMTPEQIALAWNLILKCTYVSSSGREMYEESRATSVGGYNFWFYNGKLEDWSWTEPVYFPSFPTPSIGYLSPDGEWYGY